MNAMENNKEINAAVAVQNPLVSVLIPVYNAENCINNCIDSILKQTEKDFEIIIVNDGSTDNTLKVLSKYKDKRIKIFNKEHSGISNSLNIGITLCKGKYIARLDADDLMLEVRLSVQVDYMEKNINCDILSTGCLVKNIDGTITEYTPKDRIVTFDELLITNNITHPTIMFRKESLNKLDFNYESMYDGCEDYKLWFNCLSRDLSIHIISNHTIIYNNDKNQRNNAYVNKKDIINRIKQSYTNKNKGELTCIITFYNEGPEIERTVNSIRATSKNTRILLVNDSSNDNINYKKVADLYNCDYYVTPNNLGVGGCRHYAVSLCETEYFVLMDGHMRFYNDDWDEIVLKEIKKNDNGVLCTAGGHIKKVRNIEYINEANTNKKFKPLIGAYINFSAVHQFFSATQLIKLSNKNKHKNIIEIPCVLGAFYVMSKRWYYNIGGLNSLRCYGGDEQLLSVSTYLKGGKCKLLTNIVTGHVYKTVSDYSYRDPVKVQYNTMLMCYLYLSKNEFNSLIDDFIDFCGESNMNKIIKMFNDNSQEIEKLKHTINKDSKRTFKDYMKFNAKYIYDLQVEI